MSNSISLGSVVTDTSVIDSVRLDSNTGELYIIYRDGSETNLGKIIEPTPTVVNSYYDSDDGNVYAVYSDGSSIVAATASELGIKTINSVEFDEPTNDIVAYFSDGSTKVVVNALDLLPPRISTTFLDEEEMAIYAIFDNGETEFVADVSYILENDFRGDITDMKIDENNELIVTTTLKEYNLGNVGTNEIVHGKDAESSPSIVDLKINDNTGLLEAEFSDGSIIEVGRAQNVIIEGGELSLTEARISTDGDLMMTILTEDGVREENVGRVRPENGKDGTVFTEANVTPAGELEFIDQNGTVFKAGSVPHNSIIGAKLNMTGELVLEMQDNTEINVGSVMGRDGIDGIGLKDVRISDTGYLLFELDDTASTVINAGLVVKETETAVRQDEDGSVVFTMSDGTERNIGKLPMATANYVESITNTDEDVYVKMSGEGQEKLIGTITGYPQAINFNEEGKLVLTLNNDQEIVSDDVIFTQPLDGDGITNVWSDGNDLKIAYTTNNRTETDIATFSNIKGIGIKEVTVDNDNYKIIFELTDGKIHEVEMPRGKDAIGIEDIALNTQDELVFSYTDGTLVPFTLSDIRGTGTKFVRVDADGNLVFQRTNPASTATAQEEEYTLDVITGTNAIGMTGLEYDDVNETIIVHRSDGTDTIIPAPKGEDGVGISEVVKGENLLTFKLSDGTSHSIDVPVGIIQENSVSSITYDEVGEELVVAFEPNEAKPDIRISVPKPIDGDQIERAYIDTNGDLVFEIDSLTDPLVFPTIKGTTPNSITRVTQVNNSLVIEMTQAPDKVVNLPIGIDGNSIEDVVYDSITNQLTFKFTKDVDYVIDGFKGTDAVNITDISYDSTTEEIVVSKDDSTTYRLPFPQAVDGKGITDFYIDATDNLIIKSDLTVPDTEIAIASIRGTDGIDGVGVQSIEESANGSDIVFKMTDTKEYTIPNALVHVTGVDVTSTGTLKFTMSNGIDYETTESLQGRDGNGRGVTDVSFVNGEFVIKVAGADGLDETITTGNVSMISISDITINELGELIFTLADGKTENLGRVEGKNGTYLKTASVTSNGVLITTLSDGVTDTQDVVGNVRGEDGRHVVSFDVDYISGDVSTTYSDSITQVIGNIREQTQLGVWSTDERPYSMDRVVLHQGRMFISKITNNNYTPPNDTYWNEVMLSDYMPELSKPFSLDGDMVSYSTNKPTLQGSVFQSLFVDSVREQRVFEVYQDGTLLRTETTANDSISLTGMTEGTYTYRFQDVSSYGNVSPWSDTYTFTIAFELKQPTISMGNNITDLLNVPLTFDVVSSSIVNTIDEPQVVTQLQVEVYQGTTLVATTNELDTLTSTIIGYDVLAHDSNYSIRLRAFVGSKITEWSELLDIKTEPTTLNYHIRPVVFYLGDATQVPINGTEFRASQLQRVNSLIQKEVPVTHLYNDWEVVDESTGTSVVLLEKNSNIHRICLSYNFSINKTYRVRVRQFSKEFGYTEWSDWLSFTTYANIEKPVITTLESTTVFPLNGIVTASDYVSTNAPHLDTSWEITDFYTGQKLIDLSHYSRNIKEVVIPLYHHMVGKTISVKVRYNSDLLKSEWSDPLVVTMDDNPAEIAYAFLATDTFSKHIYGGIDDYSNIGKYANHEVRTLSNQLRHEVFEPSNIPTLLPTTFASTTEYYKYLHLVGTGANSSPYTRNSEQMKIITPTVKTLSNDKSLLYLNSTIADHLDNTKNSDVVCYNTITGQEFWRTNFMEYFGAYSPYFQNSIELYNNEHVFISMDNSVGQNKLLYLDLDTGNVARYHSNEANDFIGTILKVDYMGRFYTIETVYAVSGTDFTFRIYSMNSELLITYNGFIDYNVSMSEMELYRAFKVHNDHISNDPYFYFIENEIVHTCTVVKWDEFLIQSTYQIDMEAITGYRRSNARQRYLDMNTFGGNIYLMNVHPPHAREGLVLVTNYYDEVFILNESTLSTQAIYSSEIQNLSSLHLNKQGNMERFLIKYSPVVFVKQEFDKDTLSRLSTEDIYYTSSDKSMYFTSTYSLIDHAGDPIADTTIDENWGGYSVYPKQSNYINMNITAYKDHVLKPEYTAPNTYLYFYGPSGYVGVISKDDGSVQWQNNSIEPYIIATDKSGMMYLQMNGNKVITKMRSDKSIAWNNDLAITSGVTLAYSMTVGYDTNDGFVYVSGRDGYIFKLSSVNGSIVSTLNTGYNVQALTVDSTGNIHIIDSTFYARKLRPDGTEIWSYYNSENMRYIVFDNFGNAYVSVTRKNIVVKIGATGTVLWTYNNAFTQQYEQMVSLAIDNTNNILYCGDRTGYLMKLDLDKNVIKRERVSYDYVITLGVEDEGVIYITDNAGKAMKLDKDNLATIWERSYSFPGASFKTLRFIFPT